MDIIERLDACDRETRRAAKRTLVANALLVLSVGIGVVGGYATLRSQAPAEVDVLRLSELVIVDDAGVERVRIGAHLPDAIVDGESRPRGEDASGLLLYDETGRERVTWAPSGNVGLTLDSHEGQVTYFVAGREGGSALKLWSGNDWIELRADDGGAHLNAIRSRELAFQEPPMSDSETGAVCSSLRAEVDRLNQEGNSIPEDVINAACRERMPADACQACLGSP